MEIFIMKLTTTSDDRWALNEKYCEPVVCCESEEDV